MLLRPCGALLVLSTGNSSTVSSEEHVEWSNSLVRPQKQLQSWLVGLKMACWLLKVAVASYSAYVLKPLFSAYNRSTTWAASSTSWLSLPDKDDKNNILTDPYDAFKKILEAVENRYYKLSPRLVTYANFFIYLCNSFVILLLRHIACYLSCASVCSVCTNAYRGATEGLERELLMVTAIVTRLIVESWAVGRSASNTCEDIHRERETNRERQ